MIFMLVDHIGAKLLPQYRILRVIGRLAFPIFAFQIAEGYFHTSNFKRYAQRLLVFALISESPFNLLIMSSPVYPFHQNVMFTFCIALVLLHMTDKAWNRHWWEGLLVAVFGGCFGYGLGFLTFVDYYHAGVLTVLVFYFFHERKWWAFLLQAACLYYINIEMLGGLYVPVELFGETFELHQQSLALLALIPIWLYRGRKGNESVLFRFACYFFYPAHILLLVALMLLGVRF